jgi:hypothetical protein
MNEETTQTVQEPNNEPNPQETVTEQMENNETVETNSEENKVTPVLEEKKDLQEGGEEIKENSEETKPEDSKPEDSNSETKPENVEGVTSEETKPEDTQPENVEGVTSEETGEDKPTEETQPETETKPEENGEPTISEEEEKAQKKEAKRVKDKRAAIQEILQTENTYVKQLGLLETHFMIPIRESLTKPGSILPPEDYTGIFVDLEMIIRVNDELLSSLKDWFRYMGYLKDEEPVSLFFFFLKNFPRRKILRFDVGFNFLEIDTFSKKL